MISFISSPLTLFLHFFYHLCTFIPYCPFSYIHFSPLSTQNNEKHQLLHYFNIFIPYIISTSKSYLTVAALVKYNILPPSISFDDL